MNILMLHPHDIYSPQEPWTVRVTYLAGEFVRRGHQVKLIYHLFDPNMPLEEARHRQEHPFETIPSVRYHSTLLKKIRDMISLGRWADVIHFQKCFSHVSLPSLFGSYITKTPVHYDWDDWEYEIYNYRPMNKQVGEFINSIEQSLPPLVDSISVASAALRQMALDLGARPDRIVEGHVGADLTRFHPGICGTEVRERYGIKGPLVLYLGQLHGAQYCELFLHAARAILDRRQDVTFMVVGHGDRFGELVRLKDQLGLGSQLIFTGPVDHEEVPLHLAAADVLTACFADTKQTRTKSPLKVVEYLAMGRPIVASRMGEVIPMLDGGCGLLTKPGDVPSLAEGITTVLENPDMAAEMGRKARIRAEEKYNWGVTATNILGAYKMDIEEYDRLRGKKKSSL